MKLLFEREPLHRALSDIVNVVDRIKLLPILDNVKLQIDSEGITLTTTDTELQMVAQLALAEGETIKEPFEITLGAQKFLDIIASVKDEFITVEFDEGKATIRTDQSRFTLATLPVEGFPQLDLSQFDLSVTISKKNLKALITKTSFAISAKDIRAPLRGLLFEAKGATIKTVATDGHRLALAHATLDTEVSEDCRVIVPRKAVLEIVRLVDDSDENITLSINSNFISFTLERYKNLIFASKLIVGQFPAYTSVIPQNNPHTYSTNVGELSYALKQAILINREPTRQVRMNITTDSTKISSKNKDQEDSEISLISTYDGTALEVAFNESYLQEALSTLKNDLLNMKIATASGSILIEETDEQVEVKHVIMPMTI